MENKIKVNFFQRRPRKGFSFSLEYIFADVRKRLRDRIDAEVYISRCYNDGYWTKIVNIAETMFREEAEVNHITGELHFLNLLMPRKKVLLTVLDCGVMSRKRGLARVIVKWLYLTIPVRKARFVTAISEVTKQEVIAYTKCPPEKIHVIPVAIDPGYLPSPGHFNQERPEILHIGTGFNKNLLRLIEAVSALTCTLTIVGKLNQEQLDALGRFGVEYTNVYDVSTEQMNALYIRCEVLAFVSTSEGFGMPIIEANAVERVVVTSNISAMPEVAADAACLVDPFSVASIREGILRVINDEGYRNKLLENGRRNKLRFDGDAVADSYFHLYHKIARS